MYRFKRLVCLGALAMLAVSGASAAGNASCSWSTQPDTLEQVKPHRKARKNPSLPAQGGQGRVPLIVDTTLFEPSDDASSSSFYYEFVLDPTDSDCIEYNGHNSSRSIATGFFVGEAGTIVTARHVAKPWEMTSFLERNKSLISIAERELKEELECLMSSEDIMDINVEGHIDNIIIVPNGKYFISQSSLNCTEIACSGAEQDLALLKILSDHLPLGVTPVPFDKISTEEPKKGEHVLAIGFPGGLDLFDNLEKTEIQANATAGSVTRTDGRYNFGLDANIANGSSGSPIFDVYGNVLGVLNARHVGIEQAYAIRSECLSALLKEAGITK